MGLAYFLACRFGFNLFDDGAITDLVDLAVGSGDLTSKVDHQVPDDGIALHRLEDQFLSGVH